MGITNKNITVPRVATAACVAFTFGKIGTADGEVTPAGAGDQILGIFDDTQAIAGKAVPFVIGGLYKVKLGGTVTRGDKLKSDSAALAVSTSTDTQEYGAVALSSGVVNDIIDVLVIPAQTFAG